MVNTKSIENVKVELSEEVKRIIGRDSVSLFAQKNKMTDVSMLVNLLYRKIHELPDRKILRQLAAASEGRVTHYRLYDICGYRESDPEEDRTWATWKPMRGDIYYADLGYNMDCEQSGIRPVLVIQNDVGNQHSPSVVIVPITTKRKQSFKIHIHIGKEFGLKEDSYALSEQIRSISKRRLFFNGTPWKVATLPIEKMDQVKNALEFELGFESLMFDEDKAFRMVDHIKTLERNIRVKQSKDLIELFNEKLHDLVCYCAKYHKNHNIILNEYDRVNSYAYA